MIQRLQVSRLISTHTSSLSNLQLTLKLHCITPTVQGRVNVQFFVFLCCFNHFKLFSHRLFRCTRCLYTLLHFNLVGSIAAIADSFYRATAMLSAVYAVVVCLCVCVCVCLSHSGIVSKRLNVGSRKQRCTIAP